MGYRGRLALLKKGMVKLGIGAMLVSDETDVSYLSGFACHDSMLFITPRKDVFITDSRYFREAEESLDAFEIRLVTDSTYRTISDLVDEHRVRRLGFEPMDIPYGVAIRLKKALGRTELAGAQELISRMREIKDASEVSAIKASVGLTKRVFRKVLGRLRPGATERSIAHFIAVEFLKAGAEAAFEPIVACGRNSAHPHSRPGPRAVSAGSFVMVDIGARRLGYCSDMTRTVLMGPMTKRYAEIYGTVREAQRRAIDKVRDGARISAVDFAARGYIHKKGYGRYFGHSVGHGVGMDIHEAPTVSRNNEGLLKSGMVITIEPAIYVPGFGGVRIEDMVLVTRTGCEILT
jgi:Xaa-Pro aminopeptidase